MAVISGIFRLFVLATLLKQAVASDCSGDHQYIDEEGNCRDCETCPQGYEPTLSHCGYGQRDLAYGCRECDNGFFSEENDFQFCKTCKDCSKLNSHSRQECSSESDAICGTCYPNHYRLQKSDGTTEVQCVPCPSGSELAECKAKHSNESAVIAVVAALSIALSAIICGGIYYCCRKQKGSQQSSQARKQLLESNASASMDLLEKSRALSECNNMVQEKTQDVTTTEEIAYSDLPTKSIWSHESNMVPPKFVNMVQEKTQDVPATEEIAYSDLPTKSIWSHESNMVPKFVVSPEVANWEEEIRVEAFETISMEPSTRIIGEGESGDGEFDVREDTQHGNQHLAQ